MPGGAEDKVTAFSFVQHGRLAQPPHFRGGNLRFQPEAGGSRAGKLPGQRARSKEEWFTQTRDEKKPEQTRSPWPPIALVPGFLLTCHGTFRIAIRGLASFRVILRPEAKKRRASREGFLLMPPQRPPSLRQRIPTNRAVLLARPDQQAAVYSEQDLAAWKKRAEHENSAPPYPSEPGEHLGV